MSQSFEGRRIEIVEVAPRDGLQNEATMLATEDKVALVERLVDAGARRLEVASFVHPERVPQMADAEAVLAALTPREDVTYIGLVLNRRGLDRALAANVREVNYAIGVTDTFSQRNQGMDAAQSVALYEEIAAAAKAAGVRCTATLSVAYGCPYEGEVAVSRVADLAARLADGGNTDEIAPADTIGVAAPSRVTALIEAVRVRAPGIALRCHFHNTRNTGLANAYAAVAAGVTTLDASLGGIGGCPFAPAATGNVPTEDLAFMLHRMGAVTGLDLDRLIETAKWLAGRLGHDVPALLGRAGLFPATAA
jgi:hydroxymethylglutaryl-CoA lyase